MALDLIVDSLDALPEALRTLYVADGAKFKLDVSGLEDTSGLKSALEKERKSARESEAQSKAWKSLGKTTEEIQALIEAQAKSEEDSAIKAGEFDKLRKLDLEKSQAELTRRDTEKASMQKTLESHLIDAAAISAIAQHKGSPELLLPHVKSVTQVINDNGQYKTVIVDKDGAPRVNATGHPLSIQEFVSEMRNDSIYGRAFEATGVNGSGKQSDSNSNGSVTSVASTDKTAIGANLEGIASGTIKVV
ncbi:hypothetical protein QN366_04875 [Pseudomonas sp. CCC3.2]|uniref:hypothetical protein n=1 Tax=unclassified Pseudomonas TaxID=196821 RepID=UPI002AB4CB7D|nr:MULTISPECIES: hypothetical protein [unclassified Pseudomonas]MDY7559953.1 hypothetical protein [Pseudomonas sp. AB6]MEA9994547.1 hypothetical protein [Pseudomonas sp. AA4]MEB0085692.1 hypothetical protein [Pseudomonas sp. RTI1]MEB0125983.1 hypothetical protein [Pseudomonas sp. CCC1.2]MEB0152787.1 hypothetical protein [Pseudomonas sp. CCC4.3]